MAKYGKMFIGSAIHLLTGIIGVIVWIIQQDTIKMSKADKGSFTVFLAVAFVPALIMYIIWYFLDLKKLASPAGGHVAWIPFLVIGVVAMFCIAMLPGLLFYTKAVTYAIIAFVVAAVGSLGGYLAGRSK